MPRNFSHRSSTARFYLHLRQKGIPKSEAKARARALGARYIGMTEQKKSGYVSKRALEMEKDVDKYRRVVQGLKRINPAYVVSDREASLIISIHSHVIACLVKDVPKMANLMRDVERGVESPLSPYKLSDCLEDYAYLRFTKKVQKPKRVEETRQFIRQVLERRFGKVRPEWERRIDLGGISESLIMGSNWAYDLPDFYARIRNEKGLDNPDNQRAALGLALDAVLHESASTREVAVELAHYLKKADREIIRVVREKVEGFRRKPLAVRKRIIQEYQSRFAADILGMEMKSYYGELQVLALDRLDESPANSWMRDDIRREVAINAWIVKCLGKQQNRRVLIQKAIEWVGGSA